ncbi:MAG TPA: radical SAM protein [Pirellulales bacterium]|nr:radical SAM protein [Pirellulales bacterium]
MSHPGRSIDISTRAILAARPPKNAVDAARPYAFFVERERSEEGEVVDVATLFLTNRECPWRCLMCDLWKNTTDEPVPAGAIPQQVDYALERLPPARQIKLYNSGNFFDGQAIRPADHQAIAGRVSRFERVVVENHPKLVSESCARFRDACATTLEIAMGLETVHPEMLPRLNKGMTLDDFARSVEFLLKHEIAVRAFILLRPPFLSEEEGLEWAIKSVDYAFSLGVGCCSVIPTRVGNGIMEQLSQEGLFSPPTIRSLERVLDYGLSLARGRVFADLWDIERFYDCAACGPQRAERIAAMNLSQQSEPEVNCSRCGA